MQMYGNARTNYVTVVDVEGLKRSIEPFEIILHHNEKQDTYCMVKPESSDYDFYYSVEDDDGNDIEFTWEVNVMPFIKENECLEVRAVAYDKRELCADTVMYVRRGDDVHCLVIRLDDIYDMVEEEWGITANRI